MTWPKTLIIFAFLCFVLAGCRNDNNTTILDMTSPTDTPRPTSRWPSSHTPQPKTRGAVLIDENGTGDSATKSFTLHEDCEKVIVTWIGNPVENTALVNFDYIAIDSDEELVRSGPHEIDTLSRGTDEFPLSAGRYYVQVTATNAFWTIRAICDS